MTLNTTRPIRIVWIGFHLEGLYALESLIERSIPIAAVITLNEVESTKRSGAVSYDNVCERANIPLHRIRHINDSESIELLTCLNPDLVVVLGWSQIISPEALAKARMGFVGAHASYLPHNRGSAPVNWSIIRGEEQGGNTLMWLAEGVDEGKIADQVTFAITSHDTCATVYQKVAAANQDMILRLILKLQAGERPARPQPETREPLLPRRRPKDGIVNWNGTAKQVYDFVRALTRPYPGAFSYLGGKRFTIWNASLLPGRPYPEAKSGEVIGTTTDVEPCAGCGLVVACGEGAVALLEIEDEDGVLLSGKAFYKTNLADKVWKNGKS